MGFNHVAASHAFRRATAPAQRVAAVIVHGVRCPRLGWVVKPLRHIALVTAVRLMYDPVWLRGRAPQQLDKNQGEKVHFLP